MSTALPTTMQSHYTTVLETNERNFIIRVQGESKDKPWLGIANCVMLLTYCTMLHRHTFLSVYMDPKKNQRS